MYKKLLALFTTVLLLTLMFQSLAFAAIPSPSPSPEKPKRNYQAKSDQVLLEIVVPDITVFLIVDNKGKEVEVPPNTTTEEVIKKAGIKINRNDYLNNDLERFVEDKMFITISRVEFKNITKHYDITFSTIKIDKKVVCQDENKKTAVVEDGEKGQVKEIWQQKVVDGVEQKPKLVKKEEIKAPVDREIAECIVPDPEPVTKPITGNKEQWMKSAGIPESDWKYVDYIVQKESSWNPHAVNPTSGACSLVQALPCSKIGNNWSDASTALRWGSSYVRSRYGSWQKAYEFWIINHWY